ncbi:putative ATP-dependent RNA helicase Dbp73D [Amphibalanus amphitrite]|uniref:Putative ATP-dependent RNA helicase Dbp73D n=1 Tax=Amphibalanus amphitrite TaxID=1232801 RepID=A0A6A4V2J9_AMPAM|nr:putative ATP-dependent RNA helicase Dbp73D [Amphibalanus amphitrite]
MSLFQPRLLVVGTAAAAVALPGQFVGRFTTPAELGESFNVVAPQPLKPLLMHHLLRQPDWRRSLVLVNWNEVAHQLELPLSVLGARVTEREYGRRPAGVLQQSVGETRRAAADFLAQYRQTFDRARHVVETGRAHTAASSGPGSRYSGADRRRRGYAMGTRVFTCSKKVSRLTVLKAFRTSTFTST